MLLKKPKIAPMEGDIRITFHFAWLPVQTDDGKIWLERFKRTYRWQVKERPFGLHFRFVRVECGDWDLMSTRRRRYA
jgi:hypothetical protein